MGLVHVDTLKVKISTQTQKQREPCSVCWQTFLKLDWNNYLKWFKAANKWFKRCHKVLVCRSVLRFSNLQFLFSTEDDPVHFTRTQLTVTLKQIDHFKCKQLPFLAWIILLSQYKLMPSKTTAKTQARQRKGCPYKAVEIKSCIWDNRFVRQFFSVQHSRVKPDVCDAETVTIPV